MHARGEGGEQRRLVQWRSQPSLGWGRYEATTASRGSAASRPGAGGSGRTALCASPGRAGWLPCRSRSRRWRLGRGGWCRAGERGAEAPRRRHPPRGGCTAWGAERTGASHAQRCANATHPAHSQANGAPWQPRRNGARVGPRDGGRGRSSGHSSRQTRLPCQEGLLKGIRGRYRNLSWGRGRSAPSRCEAEMHRRGVLTDRDETKALGEGATIPKDA